ncbi:MAG TPA: sugar phosphate nucleotidyltransferase [Patescibacteria group bacterium]|jgi:mannose-1-phosphate guanylyltransferase/phosphomannomutase
MRTKTRLTITLAQDLVEQIDNHVDGIAVKNRSHAIETLIQNSLSPSVKTAVILLGGKHKGSEALQKIGNNYLLTQTLNMLKKHHLNKVIICLSKGNTKIKQLFGQGENLGLTISYSYEERPLGTGGAVKKIREQLGKQPFLVIYGDVLTTLDLSNLFDFHFNEGSLATMAVKPRMAEPKYGQVFLQGNKIIKFLDNSTESGISIINTGVYVFDSKVFDVFPSKNNFTLEKDVFPYLAEKKQLSASFFQGIWYEISDTKDYQAAQASWQAMTSDSNKH